MSLRLRPSENERGLTFGLTWSAVGCALAMVGLTSCGYIIPEDNRPPRYNTVVGERRAPALNNAVGVNTPPEQDENAYPQDPVPSARAPMPQGGMMPTASVAAPGAPAPAAAPGARAGSQRSFWDKSKGWIFGEDAEIRETPVPLGAPLPPGAKNELEKGQLTVAMGDSSEYPLSLIHI